MTYSPTYSTAEPTPALPYATPGAGGGSPTAAGVWVILAGLVLLFFGGCFCIGLLALTSPSALGGTPMPPPRMTDQQNLVMFVLIVIALGFFAAGAYVMILGLRKLLAVGR